MAAELGMFSLILAFVLSLSQSLAMVVTPSQTQDQPVFIVSVSTVTSRQAVR